MRAYYGVPTIFRLPKFLSAPLCRRALKNMGLFFKRDLTLQGAYESLSPHMGWQRFVGSLNCHVSFAKGPYFCRALLQKGPERARARAKGGERRNREKKKESESETERLGEQKRERKRERGSERERARESALESARAYVRAREIERERMSRIKSESESACARKESRARERGYSRYMYMRGRRWGVGRKREKTRENKRERERERERERDLVLGTLKFGDFLLNLLDLLEYLLLDKKKEKKVNNYIKSFLELFLIDFWRLPSQPSRSFWTASPGKTLLIQSFAI